MTIRFSLSDGVGGRQVRLELTGELDLATVGAVRRHVRHAMRDGSMLVLDLTGLTFIDSSGIALLLSAKRLLRHRFRLIGVQPPVEHIFAAVGLVGHWDG